MKHSNIQTVLNITIVIVLLQFICLISNSYCFDDEQTHPKLTRESLKYSKIDDYLINILGFSEGSDKQISPYWFPEDKKIKDWLQKGSTDEDSPSCRAANHFHDPLKAWDSSYVTDFPLLIKKWCRDIPLVWPQYSNITWATGYKTREEKLLAPMGRQDMNWDNARSYFYSALTETTPVNRDDYFVKTFRSFGQVLHLLEDMAVPAHVRNDFQSHLEFNGIKGNSVLAPLSWWGNAFEYYVKLNPGFITSAIPSVPVFSNPQVTDFWDTDGHGTVPGLAEFTNANYFSDETIPGNNPSPLHQYSMPQMPTIECEDTLPGVTVKTRYRSRRACPTDGSKPDHFVALSLINSEAEIQDNDKQKIYIFDKNVHNTYATEPGGLLSKAVGYSAALLDYFFRGTIEVNPVSVDTDSNTITLSVINTTANNEAMTGGTIDLVIRYRQVDDSSQQNIIPLTDYRYIDIKQPGSNLTIGGQAQDITFDLSTSPIPDWANDITAFVVYHGQLGNEADAVAVGNTALKNTPSKLTLSLPSDGVYGKTDGSTGITRINVAATANTPGLDLADGLIELFLLFKNSDSDPFQSLPVTSTPADPKKYYYVRVSESADKKVLAQGQKTELSFDVSANPLPIWASNVHLFISYKKTGAPDSMTKAVGYLDISEPTPVDAYNNTDYTCLNNTWYRYDDPAAMAIVDSNANGIADISDIYPHSISNITFQGGPADAGTLTSSPQHNNLSAAGPLPPGQMLRLGYILTDYANKYTFDEQWTNIFAQDSWNATSSTTIFPGTGFANQTDRGFGGMYSMRGKKMWWGTSVTYENDPYPSGSYCDTDLLNQPAP